MSKKRIVILVVVAIVAALVILHVAAQDFDAGNLLRQLHHT
jgi:hypothetical protein